jgi:hypothetical protein
VKILGTCGDHVRTLPSRTSPRSCRSPNHDPRGARPLTPMTCAQRLPVPIAEARSPKAQLRDLPRASQVSHRSSYTEALAATTGLAALTEAGA